MVCEAQATTWPPTANTDPKKSQRKATDVRKRYPYRGFGGSTKIAKEKLRGQNFLHKKNERTQKSMVFPGLRAGNSGGPKTANTDLQTTKTEKHAKRRLKQWLPA